jgi:2-C-methyl-D-erythritol 2,4-cyclodiphosphate synthase
VRPSDIGIKAKTPEGTGTDNAAIAHVVVLLSKGKSQHLRRKRTAAEVPQKVVDEVAKKVIEQAAVRHKHSRN